jgi:hypothetical protein
MELYYTEENEQLNDLDRIIFTKLKLYLPFNDMLIDFYDQWDSDHELSESLKEYNVNDIECSFNKVVKLYQSKRKCTYREIIGSKFLGYTKNKLVILTNNKEEIIVCNMTTGIKFSKTAYKEFQKHYNLDDITRVRLYCLYHFHSREDDNFVKTMAKNKIKYQPIDIINSLKILKLYPEVSA